MQSLKAIKFFPFWTSGQDTFTSVKGFSKTKISIHLIIPRLVPVQQSSIRPSTSTSIFPETDQ